MPLPGPSGNLMVSDGTVEWQSKSLSAFNAWIAVPFIAADYSSDIGTWTVSNIQTSAYVIIGKTLIISYNIQNSSIAGSPGVLYIRLPGGYKSARDMVTLGRIFTPDRDRIGLVYSIANDDKLRIGSIGMPDEANRTFLNGTSNIYVQFQIALELQ